MDGFSKDTEEDKLPTSLLAWIGSVRLTEREAESIRNSILEDAADREDWLERLSARIDRSLARLRRRTEQAAAFRLQLQTDRIERRGQMQS